MYSGIECAGSVAGFPLQMGVGFGAAPVVMPAAFTATVGGGLDDLFDLGGGVGAPLGSYTAPKTVSFDELQMDTVMEQHLRDSWS